MPAKPKAETEAPKRKTKPRTVKRQAPLPKTVSIGRGKRGRRFATQGTADIENLPPVQIEEQPSNMGNREALPSSVGTKATRLEREIMGSNPSARGMEVLPVSSSSAAHGYYMVNDHILYDLFDEMMDRDPIISGCVELKVAYLLMRSHELQVAALPEDATEVEEQHAMSVHAWVQKALVEHPRFNNLLWTLAIGTCQHGRSTNEITYGVNPEGYFVPDWFYHCHPGQFRFSRKGDMFLTGGRYSADGDKPATEKKYISSINPALYDNPHGMSDLLRLRFLYYFKKKGWINYVRVVEKNGVPFIHIAVPQGISNPDEVRAALEDALQMMLEDDALLTFSGEEVEVHDRVTATSESLYDGLFDRADSAIVRYILGAELASTVKDRGARSLGEVHERTVLTRVLPLARLVEAAVNLLVKWLVEWNFGPDAPAPYYKFDTEESQSTEESMKILTTAKALGIRVAVEQARGWLGTREPQPGEETITIGDLGVDAKGDITVNKNRAAVPTDSEEAKRDAEKEPEVAEDYNALDKAHAAFTAYSNDPKHRAFKSLFQDTSPVGVAFREMFAQQGKTRQAQLSARLLKVGNAAAEDTLDNFRGVFQKLSNDLAGKDKDSKLDLYRTRAMVNTLDLRKAVEDEAELVVTACAMLSLYYTTLSLQDVREQKRTARRFADGDEDYLGYLPESFAAAAQWMSQRNVMTVSAVKGLAKVIWEEKGGDLKQIERGLRSEVMALAGSTNTAATEKIQGLIATAVDKGKSVGDFLTDVDGILGKEKGDGSQDAYWNMVFRTEVGNAYKEQQELNESETEFRESLWGWEGYNPGDQRSRPTHARVDGKRFKAGGRAANVMGKPPFAYQCRCALFALMAPGGAAAFTESSDALSVASGVHKFSQTADKDSVCPVCGAE